MTDSATQSASPPVKIYHGSEIIPVGRRFERKPSIFGGLHERQKFFVSRGNFFPSGETAFPFVGKVSPLVQPATTISRFVWANSLKTSEFSHGDFLVDSVAESVMKVFKYSGKSASMY